MVLPDGPNQRWSLDFVSDALTGGRRFRILAIVDDFSRESLVLMADTSLSGHRVARELDQLIAERGMPKTIVSELPMNAPLVRAPLATALSSPVWRSSNGFRIQASTGITSRPENPNRTASSKASTAN